MMKFSVGQPHQFENELPTEGCTITIDGTGIMLIAVFPRVTEKELKNFSELKGYAFFKCNCFPLGLIIWRFAEDWLIETPFNILKEKNLNTFMDCNTNIMTRVIIDETGVVRSIAAAGLHMTFINRLKQTWQVTDLDWRNYETDLYKLTASHKTQELWNKAHKYTHQDVEAN